MVSMCNLLMFCLCSSCYIVPCEPFPGQFSQGFPFCLTAKFLIFPKVLRVVMVDSYTSSLTTETMMFWTWTSNNMFLLSQFTRRLLLISFTQIPFFKAQTPKKQLNYVCQMTKTKCTAATGTLFIQLENNGWNGILHWAQASGNTE